jgi:hypothetical protein
MGVFRYVQSGCIGFDLSNWRIELGAFVDSDLGRRRSYQYAFGDRDLVPIVDCDDQKSILP